MFAPSSSGILLVYTASVQGYVEPCGCSGDPLGGIARFKAVLDDARRAYGDRVVVVDAGDLLFEKATDNAPVDRCQAEARTALLVSTYARAGVVATTRGPLDDVRGAAFRDALLQKHKLVSLEHGQHLVVERGGKQLTLIGVAADDSDAVVNAGLQKAPPADAVIVLAQMGHKEALTRARGWKGVDVVVVGRAPEAPLAPQRAGHAIVVSAGWQAQYAGLVELHLDARIPGTPLALDDRKATAEARKKLLDVRISELDKLLVSLAPSGSPSGALSVEQSAQRAFQQQRRDAFAKERQALDAVEATAIKGPHVVVNALPLKRGMAEEQQAAGDLAFYERKIPELVSRCEQNVTCPEPPPGVATFVGMATCAGCHAEAEETWRKALVDVEQTAKDGSKSVHPAGHSKAWQTLVDAGRDKDRSCVGCHSAGFAQQGGACTTTVLVERQLTGVQCESCHGAGSLHVQGGGDKTKIKRVVDEATCRGCHVPPHIPSFDSFIYQARLPSILGPGHQRKRAP